MHYDNFLLINFTSVIWSLQLI